MSLIIDTAEVAAATALSGLVISEGQNGNGPAILKRAQTALALGDSLAGLAQGDAAASIGEISAALANSDLDPAVILGLQGMVMLGLQQAQIVIQLKAGLPIFGANVTEVLGNVSKGVIAAANAEIAKYAQPGVSKLEITPTAPPLPPALGAAH